MAANQNIFSSFLLHLHPRTVPASTLRFGLSFGLGGMALTLIVALFVTGLLQLLSYSPQPPDAYSSIQRLYLEGNMGGFVRNLHFWAGNLLVVVTFLHLLRVYCTGAVDRKRRLNWLVGVCLFVLILFANFTGYLLPWDQLAFWAVTIFTNMLSYIPLAGEQLVHLFRGGAEVGANTLHIFFALHVGLLPLTLVILLVVHFWMVRKAGGLIRAESEPVERLTVSPHLISREIGTAAVLLAMLFIFSAFVDAPLAGPANPGESPNPAKAAWYFMGLQELLLHLHPSFAICVVPALMLTGLATLPFFSNNALPGGIWFGGEKGGRLSLWVFVVVSILTAGVVVLDEQLLHGKSSMGASNLLLYRGLLPFFILVVMELVLYQLLMRLFRYTRPQAFMGVLIANVAIVLTLTIIGVWFRGASMTLVFPF